MKMRKFLLVFSILAVMFSLTACSEEKDKPFDYDETGIVIQTMDYFEQYKNVDSKYKDYYMSAGTDFEKSAVKGIDQAVNNDKVGEFESFSIPVKYYMNGGPDALANVDYTIENADDYVMVTVINHAKNRDVEVTIKYIENDDYYIEVEQTLRNINKENLMSSLESDAQLYNISVEQYLDAILEQTGASGIDELVQMQKEYAMYQIQSLPYTPEEMVVSAVYSKKELMGQAGMNTLLGMGTVFAVLIFISFIISLFKFLPKLFGKKDKKDEDDVIKMPIPAPIPSLIPAGSEELSGDDELVAVITAAIHAYEASNGNSNSKDKLVVRSIKRVR